jgi:hypothetical protein
MLLCRRRRREQRRDVELDKERESGKKTGKVVDKPELGRESCYLKTKSRFLTYGSTWSQRTGCGVQNPVFPSDSQLFLRPVHVKERVSRDGVLSIVSPGGKRKSFFYRFSSIEQKKEFMISQKERKRFAKHSLFYEKAQTTRRRPNPSKKKEFLVQWDCNRLQNDDSFDRFAVEVNFIAFSTTELTSIYIVKCDMKQLT